MIEDAQASSSRRRLALPKTAAKSRRASRRRAKRGATEQPSHVVCYDRDREDSEESARLVVVSGNHPRPKEAERCRNKSESASATRSAKLPSRSRTSRLIGARLSTKALSARATRTKTKTSRPIAAAKP